MFRKLVEGLMLLIVVTLGVNVLADLLTAAAPSLIVIGAVVALFMYLFGNDKFRRIR